MSPSSQSPPNQYRVVLSDHLYLFWPQWLLSTVKRQKMGERHAGKLATGQDSNLHRPLVASFTTKPPGCPITFILWRNCSNLLEVLSSWSLPGCLNSLNGLITINYFNDSGGAHSLTSKSKISQMRKMVFHPSARVPEIFRIDSRSWSGSTRYPNTKTLYCPLICHSLVFPQSVHLFHLNGRKWCHTRSVSSGLHRI